MVVFSSSNADEPTAQFYEQLRQRQLFGLVESDCLRRLSASTISERERGELILELSRTYAAHAWHTVGTEQDDLWQRATRVLAEHLARTKPTPRGELFETQLALIELGRAEWLLAQSELFPDNDDLRLRGKSAVDAAIERFMALEKSLNLPAAASRPAGKDSADKLSPFERRTLGQQVRFRLGIARLTQARLATANADRAVALVAADEWLLPLATGPNNERLTWDGLLAIAEVARLRGDLDRSAKFLAAFEKTIADNSPLELRERFVIERLRLMLAQRQPADAITWLLEQSRTGVLQNVPPSAELTYWKIAAELAAWRLTAERNDQNLAAELWDQITADVDKLTDSPAGYWGARAKLDWQREREAQTFGRELADLVRKARAAFSSGRADEALQRYELAIAAAKKRRPDGGTTSLLLELRDTRASLLFQAKRFDEAAIAFRELAEAPRHERSAATHLLWAFCLGKQFESDPTDARRADFLAVLTSLRERYTDQPEASEAAWLMGQTLERQQHFLEAIESFASVPEKHTRYDEAGAGIARCHEGNLSRLRAEDKPTTDAEKAAIKQMLPRAQAILQASGAASAPRSDDETANRREADAALLARNAARSELLVRLARLLLEKRPADDKTADQLLAAVIAQSQEREWLRAAKQLRVVSLAGRRQIDEADRLIESLEAAGPDELLSLLDGLSAVASRSDVGTQRFVAELQLRASQPLADSPSKLTESQRIRMWRARAEAFSATGQPSKAVAVYQQLIEKSPRDPKLLRTAAESFESMGSPAGNQQAKGAWRKLEGLLKAGSAEWLDARWHVIRCCRKLGENAEADKLLKLTKLLYPDLGGDAMRAKYDELSGR
jgi:tetratricopeptide (TPR) repeat protein